MEEKIKHLKKMMTIGPDPAVWARKSLGANEAFTTTIQPQEASFVTRLSGTLTAL